MWHVCVVRDRVLASRVRRTFPVVRAPNPSGEAEPSWIRVPVSMVFVGWATKHLRQARLPRVGIMRGTSIEIHSVEAVGTSSWENPHSKLGVTRSRRHRGRNHLRHSGMGRVNATARPRLTCARTSISYRAMATVAEAMDSAGKELLDARLCAKHQTSYWEIYRPARVDSTVPARSVDPSQSINPTHRRPS